MPDGFSPLSGRGLQPAASEPFADRTVVCLEHCVCQQHGEDEHSGAHCGMGVERGVRMGVDPVDLHIDKREVRKVEGVGELAEEVAYLHALLAGYAAACPSSDYQREDEQDAERVVRSVEDVALSVMLRQRSMERTP